MVQVRIAELRRLEMCERTLAYAYRTTRAVPGITESELQRLALAHFEHAALLRGRIVALGGPVPEEDELDDSWLVGEGVPALKRAELRSILVYHDHLLDHDPVTVRVMEAHILPDHERALERLDPDYVAERDIH